MREIKLHHINKDEPETAIRIHAVDDIEGTDVHFYSLTGFQFPFNDEPTREVPIVFQQGDPAKGWNGLTLESVLAVCADRLEHLQQGEFACTENEVALMNIHKAITQLHNRHKRLQAGAEDLRTLRAEDGGEEAKQIAEAITQAGGDWDKQFAQEEQRMTDLVSATIGVEGEPHAKMRLIPILNDKTKDHFLSEEQVMPILFTLTDESPPVKTSALKTGMPHDLMALAHDVTLEDLGLIQLGDGIDQEAAVQGFYVEFTHNGKKEVLPFSTEYKEGLAMIEPFGGQATNLALSFEGMFTLTHDSVLAVVDEANPVNWAMSTITKELVSPAFEVQFQVGLAGMLSVPHASINVSPSGLYLTRFIQPGNPDVEVEVDKETKEKITHLLKTATVIGYDVVVYRQHTEPKAAAE